MESRAALRYLRKRPEKQKPTFLSSHRNSDWVLLLLSVCFVLWNPSFKMQLAKIFDFYVIFAPRGWTTYTRGRSQNLSWSFNLMWSEHIGRLTHIATASRIIMSLSITLSTTKGATKPSERHVHAVDHRTPLEVISHGPVVHPGMCGRLLIIERKDVAR